AIADIIKRKGKMVIFGAGDGFRNPVSAKNIYQSIVNIIDNPKTYNKIYNIGGDGLISYRDMIEKIAAYIGKPVKFVNIPFLPQIVGVLSKLYQLKNINKESVNRMNRDLVSDNDIAEIDFDYNPDGFLEGDIVI
ncbi:MAG: hypothetical protein WCJ33_08325, partial [Pseudomonadota bacterium]